MISWPWDSVVEGFDEETGFPLYDRSYTAEEMREVLKTFFSNGVFTEQADAFATKAGDGMSVTVSPGRCFINGDVGVETAPRTMAFAAASSKPRYDTIVLRWDNNIDARSVDLYVKQGTAQDKPVRPTLTRGQTVYELGICDVYIPNGTTSITQDRITDTRLESARCGSVQPFQTIDTTTFFDQIQAAVDRATALAEEAIDGTLYGKLEGQISEIDDKVTSINDYTTGINLLRGTRDFVKGSEKILAIDSTPVYKNGFVELANSATYDTDNEGFKSIRYKDAGGSYGNVVMVMSSAAPVQGNKQYTLSADIMFRNVTDDPNAYFFGVYITDNSGKPLNGNIGQHFSFDDIKPNTQDIKANKWYRCKVLITTPNSSSVAYMAVQCESGGSTNAVFRKLKLEEGNINNPVWSASPFDVAQNNELANLKSELDSSLSDLSGLFVETSTNSVQKQILASSSDAIQISLNIPNGYRPICLTRVSTGNNGLMLYYFEIGADGKVTINARNLSASNALTGTFSAKAICVKSKLFG